MKPSTQNQSTLKPINQRSIYRHKNYTIEISEFQHKGATYFMGSAWSVKLNGDGGINKFNKLNSQNGIGVDKEIHFSINQDSKGNYFIDVNSVLRELVGLIDEVDVYSDRLF